MSGGGVSFSLSGVGGEGGEGMRGGGGCGGGGVGGGGWPGGGGGLSVYHTEWSFPFHFF